MSTSNRISVPVQPANYFHGHADGNGPPMNGMEASVRLPQSIKDWVVYARSDFPGQTRNQLDIVSLAIEFGATRPIASWGYPVDRFTEIRREILKREMNGEVLRNWGPGKMDHSGEEKIVTDPHKYRIGQNTINLLEEYGSLLQVNQSVVVRHLMAISFRWYNQDVFEGEFAEEMSQPMQRYVTRFRREIEGRLEYARSELDMSV